MDILPKVIIQYIMNMLSYIDVVSFRKTCHKYRYITSKFMVVNKNKMIYYENNKDVTMLKTIYDYENNLPIFDILSRLSILCVNGDVRISNRNIVNNVRFPISLTHLILSYNIHISDLSYLTNLKTIDIRHNENISIKLPPAIENISINNSVSLTDFSNYTRLKKIVLINNYGSDLYTIELPISVTNLAITRSNINNFVKLTNITVLSLSNSNYLSRPKKKISLAILQKIKLEFLTNLRDLILYEYDCQELPQNIIKLAAYNCRICDLSKTQIITAKTYYCNNINYPTSVEYIETDGYIRDTSHLVKLNQLYATNCRIISSSVTILNISNYRGTLSHLNNLSVLVMRNSVCENFPNNITCMKLVNCNAGISINITNLHKLSKLCLIRTICYAFPTNIRVLEIRHLNIFSIGYLSNLKSLSIFKCNVNIFPYGITHLYSDNKNLLELPELLYFNDKPV